MKKENPIPKPPPSEKISFKQIKNIKGWIEYFKNLSPRIRVFTFPNEKVRLDKIKYLAEKQLDLQRGQSVEWPDESEILFVVSMDSSSRDSSKTFLVDDTYMFCKGIAFGVTYFSLESWFTDEKDNNSLEYGVKFVLQGFSEGALSWEYITKMIKEKIEEIENSVPKTPSS